MLPLPTKLENFAGSVSSEAALTLVGVLSGNPLAALLPVLSNSLASGRQKKRVEAALADINSVLTIHANTLRNINDAQYKLINEVILTLLHTTTEEKLVYLRRAVRNSLEEPDMQAAEAAALSRIIRDISAEEADFLISSFSYQRIQLGDANGAEDGVLVIPIGGREELVVSGLISLGLLISAGPTIDDIGLLRFSNAVAKVIALLHEPDTK